ncbi:MAG: hypothetical protein ACUVQK_10600 [Thermogutta sp.]
MLIIMADDCTHNNLPNYVGRNAQVPRLERLVRERFVFDFADIPKSRAEFAALCRGLDGKTAWDVPGLFQAALLRLTAGS